MVAIVGCHAQPGRRAGKALQEDPVASVFDHASAPGRCSQRIRRREHVKRVSGVVDRCAEMDRRARDITQTHVSSNRVPRPPTAGRVCRGDDLPSAPAGVRRVRGTPVQRHDAQPGARTRETRDGLTQVDRPPATPASRRGAGDEQVTVLGGNEAQASRRTRDRSVRTRGQCDEPPASPGPTRVGRAQHPTAIRRHTQPRSGTRNRV
jgi:hypothetical protein